MAKGQRRSNREAKKPKQPKSEKKTAGPLPLLAPERGLARAQKGRELSRRERTAVWWRKRDSKRRSLSQNASLFFAEKVRPKKVTGVA